MAMTLGSGGKGRGRYRPLSEINVTPLVDVMLVLLIIFMVTAPLMSSSVNVDLPKANASAIAQQDKPITVAIDASGKIFLQDSEVPPGDLVGRLQSLSQDERDHRIFVRADKANSYGHVIEVMGTIAQGGFTKVALLTEQPAGGPLTPVAPAN